MCIIYTTHIGLMASSSWIWVSKMPPWFSFSLSYEVLPGHTKSFHIFLDTILPCLPWMSPRSSSTVPYLFDLWFTIFFFIECWYLRCCGCPWNRGRQHLATPLKTCHKTEAGFLQGGCSAYPPTQTQRWRHEIHKFKNGMQHNTTRCKHYSTVPHTQLLQSQAF